MKNCDGCDNVLGEDATMCYVCYAKVGEGIPRPEARPLNTSNDWLIIGGIIAVLIILAFIMMAFVDIQTARIIKIGLLGVSILIGFVKWVSGKE